MTKRVALVVWKARWSLTAALLTFAVVPTALLQAGLFSHIFSPHDTLAFSGNGDINSQNMNLLHAARNIDPNPAKGGGDITIVGGSALLAETGPSGSLADIEDHPKTDQISIYVVREGDSLSQIADMFGVSTNTIIWGNDIADGELISTGQTLVILPISGLRHTVIAGDTVQSIAKQYKGDVEEIMQYNDLSPGDTLAVGSIVVVPDGEIAAPTYNATYVDRIADGDLTENGGGYYLRPIDGGYRSQGLHGYNGIDLAASYGTPILAAAAGDVLVSENSGWNGGYGKYVVVKHDNSTQTLYAHASEIIVYAGVRVVKGQVIGYVGSTGKSTGAHLHFEVRGARNPF